MDAERIENHLSFFSLDFSWLLARFRQRVREILPSSSTERPQKAADFEFIDVMAEFLLEAEHLQPGKETAAYTVQTLRTQLSAVLREQFHMLFQEDYSVIDLDRFVLENRLHIAHPGYRDVDLGEYFEKAAEVAQSPQHRRRYRLEADQFRMLHDALWRDLTSPTEPAIFATGEVNLPLWQPVAAQQALPASVAESLGIDGEETVFVHRKHALVLPQNKEIYPEGRSYLNIYQLVFLPRLNQVILLTDHLYQTLTSDQLAQMLRALSEEPLPQLEKSLPAAAAEEVLLQTVITLPPELRTKPTVQIFLEVLQHVAPRSPQDLPLETEQQRVVQKFMGSQSNIRRAVAFLTQVLIAEYTMCSRVPSATGQLLERLHVAMEMVFNPLFTGVEMNVAASKQVYMEMLFSKRLSSEQLEALKGKPVRSWLRQLPVTPEGEQSARLQKLQQTVMRLQRESRQLETDHFYTSTLRVEAITSLSQKFPNILKRVAGEAMCNGMSAGGLSDMLKSSSMGNMNMLSPAGLNFQSLEKLISRGPVRDTALLAQEVGTERAKLWKMGVCVCGENCHFPGAQQLVGECGVCLLCEKMPRQEYESLKSQQDLQDWFTGEASSGEEAVETGRRHWKMPANDLVPYLMTERAALR